MKKQFLQDLVGLGFDREAVEDLAEQGVQALDRNIAVEILSTKIKLR